MRLAASLIVLVAPLPRAQEAVDPAHQWAQWRGPLATGVAPHATPPLTWSEEENVRWKVPLPGKGQGTPIVWGDRVFVTAAEPTGEPFAPLPETSPGAHDNERVTSAYRYLLMALDRATGKVLWERALAEAIPHEGVHYTGTHASASPITDGRDVFAFFGSRGLFAVDVDGEPLWSVDLGDMRVKHGHGEGGSPVLFGDTLLVNWDHEGDSFIVALDKRNGEERWRVERDEVTSWATPIVVEHGGKLQAVVSGSLRVRSYDLESGEVLWECGGLSRNVVASPVAADGKVYVASSYDKQAMLGIALEGAEGDITRAPNVLWTRRARTPYVPSPLLYEGALYILHHYQGKLSRLVAETGEEPAPTLRLPGMRSIYASPVAADGRVYVTDLDGATAVLSHEARPQVLAVNRLDDGFGASAALAGRELFLRGERFLYCIAEEEAQ